MWVELRDNTAIPLVGDALSAKGFWLTFHPSPWIHQALRNNPFFPIHQTSMWLELRDRAATPLSGDASVAPVISCTCHESAVPSATITCPFLVIHQTLMWSASRDTVATPLNFDAPSVPGIDLNSSHPVPADHSAV